MKVTIRYAKTDADIVAIHQFLCVVAQPFLAGPIDAPKSAVEVWRVVNDEVAVMAMNGDTLVGTLGLICIEPWWGSNQLLTNRWFFTLPGSRSGKPLLKEAKAIAVAADMELHIIAEERNKVTILNRKPRHRPKPE